MGKYDDAMYRYLSDNDRFADLFNAALFDGKVVVQGKLLMDVSERYVEVVSDVVSQTGAAGGQPRYEKSIMPCLGASCAMTRWSTGGRYETS